MEDPDLIKCQDYFLEKSLKSEIFAAFPVHPEVLRSFCKKLTIMLENLGVEVHEDLDLCLQVIDAVQLGLHLGPSSPEIPWLGLIIGILMFYHNICPINIFSFQLVPTREKERPPLHHLQL